MLPGRPFLCLAGEESWNWSGEGKECPTPCPTLDVGHVSDTFPRHGIPEGFPPAKHRKGRPGSISFRREMSRTSRISNLLLVLLLDFLAACDTNSCMERVHIKIHGRVQGVFFRAHTQEEASRLCLTGWVRNTYDGGVEVMAEGDRKSLEALITWCRHGPPSARVNSIDVEWIETTGEFRGFRVTY